MSRKTLILVLVFVLAMAFGRPRSVFAVSDRALTIHMVGPVEISKEMPGAAIFAVAGDLISGELHDMPYPVGIVQLAVRANQGPWVITLSSTDVVRTYRPTEWAIPASALACETRDGGKLEVAAIFARRRLPAGRLDNRNDWGHLARSEAVQILCASAEKVRLDVVEVGSRLVKPRDAPRVTHLEDIRVLTAGVPEGAILQLCVTPFEVQMTYCQDGAHPLSGRNWYGIANFGRTDVRRGPAGLEFVDSFSRFRLKAIWVRKPLPAGGSPMTPAQWLSFQRLLLAESREVEVIRAFRPGQARVTITSLGTSTDGSVRLSEPYSRVEGQFQPLPGYVRDHSEIISVLVRDAGERDWIVAGSATLGGDLTHWVLPVAELNTSHAPLSGEKIAIATVSLVPFPRGLPVGAEILNHTAVSISDELRFRLIAADGETR